MRSIFGEAGDVQKCFLRVCFRVAPDAQELYVGTLMCLALNRVSQITIRGSQENVVKAIGVGPYDRECSSATRCGVPST